MRGTPDYGGCTTKCVISEYCTSGGRAWCQYGVVSLACQELMTWVSLSNRITRDSIRHSCTSRCSCKREWCPCMRSVPNLHNGCVPAELSRHTTNSVRYVMPATAFLLVLSFVCKASEAPAAELLVVSCCSYLGHVDALLSVDSFGGQHYSRRVLPWQCCRVNCCCVMCVTVQLLVSLSMSTPCVQLHVPYMCPC
jgi:hypothetical protein